MPRPGNSKCLNRNESLPLGVSRRLGVVAALWRYPVKGMQGESLQQTEIDQNGVLGDRVYALQELSPDRSTSDRSPPRVVLSAEEAIQLRARYLREPRQGEAQGLLITAPNGASLTSGDVGMDIFISSALNRKVRLIPIPEAAIARASNRRALHLLTTASLRKLRQCYPAGDFDPRRFRPNIVIETPDDQKGFLEENWLGLTLLLGAEVQIRVEEPNTRCMVPTLQQGDLPFDPGILETIATVNRSNLGVMCSVIKGGIARVGDELRGSE
jgi:uncharacterized protein YcbX